MLNVQRRMSMLGILLIVQTSSHERSHQCKLSDLNLLLGHKKKGEKVSLT